MKSAKFLGLGLGLVCLTAATVGVLAGCSSCPTKGELEGVSVTLLIQEVEKALDMAADQLASKAGPTPPHLNTVTLSLQTAVTRQVNGGFDIVVLQLGTQTTRTPHEQDHAQPSTPIQGRPDPSRRNGLRSGRCGRCRLESGERSPESSDEPLSHRCQLRDLVRGTEPSDWRTQVGGRAGDGYPRGGVLTGDSPDDQFQLPVGSARRGRSQVGRRGVCRSRQLARGVARVAWD